MIRKSVFFEYKLILYYDFYGIDKKNSTFGNYSDFENKWIF